jgi:flagellar motor switch/type III secretory pathway protein FliN
MKAEKLNKILASNDEVSRINQGKKLWATVRRKRMVIRMIAKLGEGTVIELDKMRFRGEDTR